MRENSLYLTAETSVSKTQTQMRRKTCAKDRLLGSEHVLFVLCNGSPNVYNIVTLGEGMNK